MSLSIKEVVSSSDLKKFICFPHKLFKGDPLYVPCLDSSEKKILTNHPALEHSEIKMWLVEKDGQIQGRIACIINNRYNEYYNLTRARFGWWDTINDYEVTKLLFDTASIWAKSKGMTEIHGPLSFNTTGKQALTVEGFDKLPQATNIYNYPYYVEFIEKYGFEKELDWIQTMVNPSQEVPEKLVRISNMLIERYNLRFLDVTKLKKDSPVIKDFFQKFNDSFVTVPNFIPFSQKEIDEMAALYVRILNPEACCIVVDENDSVVCFAVCIPSMSRAFQKAKGKLFPFGWYHILRGFKNREVFDMIVAGADPKWQNKGVSAIFHTYMSNGFVAHNITKAITNPQLETNNIRNVWARYGDKGFYIRRRCYVKSL